MRDGRGKSHFADRARRPKGRRIARKVTLLGVAVGLAVLIYAVATLGYGYYRARAAQGEMRSGFQVTGSGSVDGGYLEREAWSLAEGLTYLDTVGELYIPAIDCRWMIVEGSDDAALSRGPGHIEETLLPGMGGNFAVAGDRVLYGAPFFNLDDIAAGDEVSVKMPYATFVYTVRESFVVAPDDVSVLQPTGYEAITLLTCDPPWDIKRRIVVRGELSEILPAGSGL